MSGVAFFSLARQHGELRQALLEATERVIRSGQLILGAELERFEAEFAAFCGVRHAIGVGNGLDALTLILRALDVVAGTEVIVPGHTFIATWLAVQQAGATIVPADIDAETCNIDVAAVEAAITPHTRAIIAVHLYGRPAAMSDLSAISQRHGIALIEDAAQAHGATYGGAMTGALGTAAAFSFYPTKNLGALGDGGAVTTNDDRLAERVRRLRNYGSLTKYRHEESGVNSRLDELQAAYLRTKLAVLASKNSRRRTIAARYNAGLCNIPGLILPLTQGPEEPVWHLYVVQTKQRDRLREALARFEIGTLIHYPVTPQRQPAYAETPISKFDLPQSDLVARQVLSLPMWPEMTDEEVDEVIHAVRDAAVDIARRGY